MKFRKVRVVREGVSRKVVAGAAATLLTAVAMRYGVELDKLVEALIEFAAGAAAGYLVPEKE